MKPTTSDPTEMFIWTVRKWPQFSIGVAKLCDKELAALSNKHEATNGANYSAKLTSSCYI
jgi:hypothetical protein